MRAVRYHEQGSVDFISVEDIDCPEPGPGEALIKIGAVSLNGFDPMILMGTTKLKNPLPMIPCGDGAGSIVAFGSDDTNGLSPGQRVSVLPFGDFGMRGETALGLASDYAVLPVDNLIPIPDGVSDIEAAALPIAYGTAYRMMHTRGHVSADDKVLILGAAGGVGTCCVQLAKAAGAQVIACARGRDRAEKLRALGADHVIDTAEKDFVKATRAIAGKPQYEGTGGVSMVINYVGGDTWARALRTMAHGGRMLTCGASAGYSPPTDIRYIWSFELSIIGADGWTRDDHRKILNMTANGTLKPIIHAIRPFSEARQTMAEMVKRQVFGKSILVPDEAAS